MTNGIAIFEAASQKPPEKMNDEWAWLMQQLNLPFDHYLAGVETLGQGRWRRAKNPKSYVKTVAKREANRMGLAYDRPNELVLMETHTNSEGDMIRPEQQLEQLFHELYGGEPTKRSDGVWRGGGRDIYEWDPSDSFASYRDYLLSDLPGALVNVKDPSPEYKAAVDDINSRTQEYHIHLSSWRSPKWREWCELAGFDQWETLVVEYRSKGKSRELAFRAQPDEKSRLALQAAWKRFDRTGAARLKEAIKKFPKENVPDGEF